MTIHEKEPRYALTCTRLERFSSAILVLFSVIAIATAMMGSAQAQHYTVLHNFDPLSDGYYPHGLTIDQAGNLYGTTSRGGASGGGGTVFKIDASGTETILHTFTNTPDGAYPNATVTLDSAGTTLYGTTVSGGRYTYGGTVFKVDTLGNESVVHSFLAKDGQNPYASVLVDPNENVYGVTAYGGTYSGGVAFLLTPSGKEKRLYIFGSGTDAAYPSTSLIRDPQGNFYGTTQRGGSFGVGTVYEITPDGTEIILHTFTGFTDGGEPMAEVVRDHSGNLYGTASEGGTYGVGMIFKLDPSGGLTTLHSFSGGVGGFAPPAGVAIDPAGDLYGTADGGTYNQGLIFKLDSAGVYSVLYNFKGQMDGGLPLATPLLVKGGLLFGTTTVGGTNNAGVIFRFQP